MADSVKKRCSKAKEVKAANKVELLKSCLDKKDFCGDAAYYSCMRKYFTLYPPESNNKSANKKNKVDACKGSMKFVPGDVVIGDFYDLLDKLIERFKFNSKTKKKELQTIIKEQKEKKNLNLKYRATVKSVDDKFITLNFDDYHNFKRIFKPNDPTIVQLFKSLQSSNNENNITGGGLNNKSSRNSNYNEYTKKREQQLNQLEKLKNISIPFKEFNRSDAVKYKPSSAMGHLKKGFGEAKEILSEIFESVRKEWPIAKSETKTNMGKDEENTIINKKKVYPWTGKLKLRQMVPFETKQEYIDKMANTGAEPDRTILKLYEIYDNKYHLKLIEDTLNKINEEKGGILGKLKGNKKVSQTETALKEDLTNYLKGWYPKEAHIAVFQKSIKNYYHHKNQEEFIKTDNLTEYRKIQIFDKDYLFDKNLSEYVNNGLKRG